MSNTVTALVQRKKFGSSQRKSVIMYMADRASDDGSGIWSSKANIASDTELSKRTVQRVIGDFVSEGIVSEVGTRSCNNGHTIEYRIEIKAVGMLDGTRGDTQSPVTPSHVTHDTQSPQDVTPSHPNHPITIHEPPNIGEKDQGELLPVPSRKKRSTSIPDGWVPNDRNIQDAIKLNFSQKEINDEAYRFLNHHQSKGTTFKNWDAAWRTWLGNARRFNRSGNASTNTGIDEAAFAGRYRRPQSSDCF